MKFEDILQEHNIPFLTEGHHHSREGWINIDCPFCGKGTSGYHMGYNISYGYVNCWRCGNHPLIDVVVELTGLTLGQCKKLLSEISVKKIKIDKKPRGKLVIPNNVEYLQQAHHNYLIKRRYKPLDLIKLWGVKGIGLSGRLGWRIFIPIHYHGELVSWTTRTISTDPKVTRYISASAEEEILNHKHLLYGEDFVRDIVIVFEGCFDVWKIGYGAVATMGTGYSKEQVLKLTRFKKRFICFDNEREAQQRAKKLCGLLSLYPGTTSNIQLDSKDAGSAGDKEIKKLKNLIA